MLTDLWKTDHSYAKSSSGETEYTQTKFPKMLVSDSPCTFKKIDRLYTHCLQRVAAISKKCQVANALYFKEPYQFLCIEM